MGCSTRLKGLSYRKALSIEFKIYECFGPLGFKIGDNMVIVAGKQLSPHSNKLSFHWNNDPSNRKKTNLFQRITLAKKGLDRALLIHVCQAGINRTIVLD